MDKTLFLRMPHESDYDTYFELINKREIFNNELVTRSIKGLYRKTFYLNSLISSLSLNEASMRFLKETIADLLVIMDLFQFNYSKSISINLRATIEQFYKSILAQKNIIFSNSTVYEIKAAIISAFKSNPNIHNKISALNSDYKQLCDYVHVYSDKSFSTNLVVSDFFVIDIKRIENLSRQTFRIIESFLFILILEYKEDFLRLSKHSQGYILQQLSNQYRVEITNLLN